MTLSTLSKSKEEDGVVRGLGEASDAAFAVPGVTPCFSFEAMKMRPAWKVQLPKGVKAACEPKHAGSRENETTSSDSTDSTVGYR